MDRIIEQLHLLEQDHKAKYDTLYKSFIETKISCIDFEQKINLIKKLLTADEICNKDKVNVCEFLLSSDANSNELIHELFPEMFSEMAAIDDSTPNARVFVYEFRKYFHEFNERPSLCTCTNMLNYLTQDYEHIRSSVKGSKAFLEAIQAVIDTSKELIKNEKDSQLILKYEKVVEQLQSIYSFDF